MCVCVRVCACVHMPEPAFPASVLEGEKSRMCPKTVVQPEPLGENGDIYTSKVCPEMQY